MPPSESNARDGHRVLGRRNVRFTPAEHCFVRRTEPFPKVTNEIITIDHDFDQRNAKVVNRLINGVIQ